MGARHPGRVVALRAGRFGALVALVLLALAGAPAAADPGVWLKPIEVAGGSDLVKDVAVTMNDGGDAVVVWDERQFDPTQDSVHAASRSRGVFSEPVQLSTPNTLAPRPQVVLDAAGNALALWQQSGQLLELARRPAGAGFGAATTVDDSNTTGIVPDLALAPADNALIAWTTGSTRFALQVADVTAAGALGPRTTISKPDDSDDVPHVAFGPSGEALLAWDEIDAGRVATAALRAPGDVFSVPVPLSDPTTQAWGVRAAIDADGDAIVTWIAQNGSDFVVQAALRRPGGAWSAPISLSDPSPGIDSLGIATGGDGTTTVVWSRLDAARWFVQAATRPPGGAFGSVATLSTPGQSVESPQIASGADGTTIVAWAQGTIVHAATRSPGGAFGGPADLSTDQKLLEPTPQVAIGRTGDALVVWDGYEGGTRYTAEAAAYDASPPQIDGISIPSTANPGTATRMSVAASDVSSHVTTTWSFGDGDIGEGDAVAHTYTQPGAYEVRVIATDAAGRTAVTTRQITVTAAPRPVPTVLTGPVLSRLSLRLAAFCVAGSGGHTARSSRCSGRIGSHVRFRLNEIAKVSFTVERRTTGRRAHGRCVSTPRKNRSARPCVRYVPQRGRLTRRFAPGVDRLTLTGRLNGHALAPGSYVLVATPSAAGVRGRSVRTAFRILS